MPEERRLRKARRVSDAVCGVTIVDSKIHYASVTSPITPSKWGRTTITAKIREDKRSVAAELFEA